LLLKSKSNENPRYVTRYILRLWECQSRRWLLLFWSTARRKHRCSNRSWHVPDWHFQRHSLS